MLLDSLFLDEGQDVDQQGLRDLQALPWEHADNIVQNRHVLHRRFRKGLPIFNRSIFLWGSFVGVLRVPIEPAQPDVPVVSHNDSYFWVLWVWGIDCQEVVLLLFDKLVGNLHEHSCLQLAIFGVASVQIEGLVHVCGLDLGHHIVSFLHDPAHVELVLLVLLPLFRDVGCTEVQVGRSWGIDVDFPSFVWYLENSPHHNVSDLGSVLVLEGIDDDELVGDFDCPH